MPSNGKKAFFFLLKEAVEGLRFLDSHWFGTHCTFISSPLLFSQLKSLGKDLFRHVTDCKTFRGIMFTEVRSHTSCLLEPGGAKLRVVIACVGSPALIALV